MERLSYEVGIFTGCRIEKWFRIKKVWNISTQVSCDKQYSVNEGLWRSRGL